MAEVIGFSDGWGGRWVGCEERAAPTHPYTWKPHGALRVDLFNIMQFNFPGIKREFYIVMLLVTPHMHLK
jgi:hypothetical protein